MQIRYYDTAWNDIKNSPGWFGKMCLLALANFVPVFGSMVTNGYLFGWAREISWGAHRPMPEKIFGNEDGKFWRRGWFVFVLMIAFGLIPGIVVYIGQSMQFSGVRLAGIYIDSGMDSMFGSLLYLVGVVAALFANLFAWIGSMRISIYDRLSAGFQFGTLWKMFRKDTNGIMRIFGMNLLVSLLIGVVMSVLITVFVIIFVFAGVAGVVNSGYTFDSARYMTDAQAAELSIRFIASAGIVGIVCTALTVFVINLGSIFVETLVIRAMGYWTMQFDVPRWRGQDDPLPFEAVAAAYSSQAQPQAYPQAQPQAQSQAHPQVQQQGAADAAFQADSGQQPAYGAAPYQQPADGVPAGQWPPYETTPYQQPTHSSEGMPVSSAYDAGQGVEDAAAVDSVSRPDAYSENGSFPLEGGETSEVFERASLSAQEAQDAVSGMLADEGEGPMRDPQGSAADWDAVALTGGDEAALPGDSQDTIEGKPEVN